MSQTHTNSDSHVCPWWFAYSFDNPLRRLVHKPADLLGDLVKPGQTVLDLGCGMGFFSIALAEIVGSGGKVIAVDVQQQMLDGLRRRASRKNLSSRIELHLARPDRIGLSEPVDFALAFWMLHEVPHQPAFLGEVYSLLKQASHFLVVEPRWHVTQAAFLQSIQTAQEAGFKPLSERRVRLSRAMLFYRPEGKVV